MNNQVPGDGPQSGRVSGGPQFLGKYEILRALATGGMAEIFVARAHGIEGFQKPAVIKRLRREIASDPQFVKMFLDEARVLATMHHSNIVQIYDVGEVDNSFFFAMELLRGEDVHHILSRSRKRGSILPLEHAIFIVMSTLAGLHYAHEKTDAERKPLEIVHRDVSPSNVYVTYEGDVKVIDFGIAKTAVQSTHTRFGVVKGKIRYMSPEQCAGGAGGVIDRRSDVFATAIMLWEMTVGRRLFSGTDFEVLRQIIEVDAPPPSRARADYPPELERIVMKGLQRNPEHRYQTALEMQEDLDAFARDQKLAASSLSLARYMREQFPDAIAAWALADRNDQAFASNVRELFKSQISEQTGTPSDGRAPSAPAVEDRVSAPRTLPAAVDPDAAPAANVRRTRLLAAAAVFLLAGACVFAVLHASHPAAAGIRTTSTLETTTPHLPTATAASPSAAPVPSATALPTQQAPTAQAPAAQAPTSTADAARKPVSAVKKAPPPSVAPAAPPAPAKKPSWDSDSPLLPP